MATIAGVGDHPRQRSADLFDDGRHDLLQHVPIIGIAWQGGDIGNELPALATIKRCGDGDLHAAARFDPSVYGLAELRRWGTSLLTDLSSMLGGPTADLGLMA